MQRDRLTIRMVGQWSVALWQQDDPTFRYKATATNQEFGYKYATGTDEAMAFGTLAVLIGVGQQELHKAFEERDQH